MKDWKTHFLNGTKGMPKTPEPILKGVEKFLTKEYPDNADKVNANPLAPWLVMTFINIKPENLTTEDFVLMRNVVNYFKATGNATFVKANRNSDGTYDVTPLEQACNYAVFKLFQHSMFIIKD